MAQSVIRLGIVDDRPLIRDVIGKRAHKDGRFRLVYIDAADGALKRSASTRSCQLILVNVPAIDATEEQRWIALIRQLRTQSPGTKVIVSMQSYHDRQMVPLLEAGASGFAPSDANWEELSETLLRAVDGPAMCPDSVLEEVLRRVRELLRVKSQVDPLHSLSQRESEVVRLVAEGYSNKDVAATLGISVSTAKNHMHSIRKKLGIQRRRELLGVY